jgi:hypothetical protein
MGESNPPTSLDAGDINAKAPPTKSVVGVPNESEISSAEIDDESQGDSGVNVGILRTRAHLSHPHTHRTYKTHLLGLLQIPVTLLLATYP